MPRLKISELTLIDAVAAADLFAVVDDPAGAPVTKKATLTQVLATAEKLVNKDAANGYAGLDPNGDIALSKIVPASAGSTLLGRASGAGDWQEITVGDGLTFDGTTLESSGGGGGTLTGTEAAIPAGSEGELYFPNNGIYVHRKGASAWAEWGPLFPMTEPVDGDFSWENQGGASVDATNGGIHLLCPTNASIGWRIRKMNAPATPWTLTAAFLASPLAVDFHQWGLCFRQSSDGKLHLFTIQTNSVTTSALIHSLKYTNNTTFSAAYNSQRFRLGNLVWMQISDNGTNRVCRYSADGQHWFEYSTIGRTDFLTADQIGFAGNPENSTWPLGVTLVHWKLS